MISVRKVDDRSYLQKLVSEDDIRAGLCDDTTRGSIDVEQFLPVGSKIFQVEDDGNPVGVFVFRPARDGVYEMHTIMSHGCRGKNAIAAGKLAMGEVLKTGASFISSYAFSDAPASLWYAHKLGFTDVATHPYPNTRDGRRVNITTLIATHI